MAAGANPVEGVLRFGVVEFDGPRRQVRCRGQAVAVEPKPFELLLYLARHPDRVVRRSELLEALWPGVVVSEATLSSAVRRARDVLGPERQRIVVVRKVGYRFVGTGLAAGPEASASSSNVGERAAAAEFVGRSIELRQLRRAVDAGLAGNGCFLAIAGEPGVGKTRTMEELAAHARTQGAEVLFGRCYEGGGSQVFWPWVQVFRGFAASRSEAELRAVLLGEAGDLARLTSAIGAAEPESPASDPEMQRARLLDAAVAVLRRTARARPLLVALDDLHWADKATILLLHVLLDAIAALPLVVVGTLRHLELEPDDLLADLLTSIRRKRLGATIELRGLGCDEVGLLLGAAAGATVDESIVAPVFSATEGNPLFVHEYWNDLAESAAVVRREDGWHWSSAGPQLSIPATVSEIIGRRLRRLPRATQRWLELGAVIGREFHHTLLCQVSTSSPEVVVDGLEQALVAGVIEESAAAPGRYRFTHTLFRETLYGGMSRLRRAGLHRAVGDALASLPYSKRDAQRIAALAHHFAEALPVGTHAAAVEFAVQAADEAIHACAYDDAVRHLEQAVRWHDDVATSAPADVEYRCELQLRLADAYRQAGRGAAMRLAFEEAAARARAIPAPQRLARAAIGMTSRWIPEDQAAVQLLEEALAALPAEELSLRASTMARLAKTLYLFEGTRERRETLCAEARAMALRTDDPHLLADVLADAVEALFHGDGLAEQEALADELHQAATAADDVRLRLLSGSWRIVNAMRRGHLNEADRRLAEVQQLARELRQPRFLHHAAIFDVALLIARGRLDAAEQRIAEALELGLPIDPSLARWQHWTQLSHLRREQGRLEEFLGEGSMMRLPSEAPGALFFERTSRWLIPHVFSELGRDEDARASFVALMREGLAGLPPENSRNTRISALLSISDACATVGDAAAAALLYDELARYADQWQVIGWGSAVFASVHSMLGALAAVGARWDEAEAHFEEAMLQHDRERAICAQARTLFQYARAVRRRGRRRDQERSRRLITRGLDLAQSHGLEGVAARLRRLGARDLAPPPSPVDARA